MKEKKSKNTQVEKVKKEEFRLPKDFSICYYRGVYKINQIEEDQNVSILDPYWQKVVECGGKKYLVDLVKIRKDVSENIVGNDKNDKYVKAPISGKIKVCSSLSYKEEEKMRTDWKNGQVVDITELLLSGTSSGDEVSIDIWIEGDSYKFLRIPPEIGKIRIMSNNGAQVVAGDVLFEILE